MLDVSNELRRSESCFLRPAFVLGRSREWLLLCLGYRTSLLQPEFWSRGLRALTASDFSGCTGSADPRPHPILDRMGGGSLGAENSIESRSRCRDLQPRAFVFRLNTRHTQRRWPSCHLPSFESPIEKRPAYSVTGPAEGWKFSLSLEKGVRRRLCEPRGLSDSLDRLCHGAGGAPGAGAAGGHGGGGAQAGGELAERER